MRKLVLGGLLVAAAGCHHNRGEAVLPHIDAVRPDSVVLPRGGFVDVAIVGSGFAPGMPGENIIEFAGTVVTRVPSDGDGRSIRFTVPDLIASGSESPPVMLEAGTYTIRVRTAAGTSNAATVRVIR